MIDATHSFCHYYLLHINPIRNATKNDRKACKGIAWLTVFHLKIVVNSHLFLKTWPTHSKNH